MFRILIVEDNEHVRGGLVQLLGREYAVVGAESLARAREELGRSKFDLILLDFELPDGEGTKLCVHLQQDSAHSATPVIFLTGNGAVEDKVVAFSLGAEDYIMKPCEGVELKARIKARLEKAQKRVASDEIVVCGELTFNIPLQQVLSSGAVLLALTPFEFRLLLHLAQQPDRVFSREQLLDSVWGTSVHVADRTVDSHMSGLRKKLAATSYTIQSVHGVGYKLCKKTHSRKAA